MLWDGGGERGRKGFGKGACLGIKGSPGLRLGLDRLLYFGLDWDKLGSIMTVESWYLAQANLNIGILCLAQSRIVP